ncbi:MAG TPA: CRTAC1 family protein [Labilithrix sp.]|nr:CRTAC1 family protein [Labilithrix sp.]
MSIPRHVFLASVFGLAAVAGPACTVSSDAQPATTQDAATAPHASCTARDLVAPTQDFFTDISESSGIRKGNFVANPPAPIPINDHSRLAFVDLDGDGKDDIVAHSLYPNAQKGIPFEHLVYLNNGDKTFRDVSDESGLRGVQAAFFVFGDVDNDGDQDCFAGLDIDLTGKTSELYLNDGKGHFTLKPSSGVETAAEAANAVFADFNGDAHLDLYVGNGGSNDAIADQLYLGNGDGTFKEASQRLKNAPSQPTNGVVACDYDNDGDLDIFVSHYGVSIGLGWRTLWENDGTGVFTDVAEKRGFNALATGNSWLASTGKGVDAQPGGDPKAMIGSNGFGIDCQDIDGDGLMDIWLAAISHPVDSDESRKWSDPSMLFVNQGAAGGFSFVNAALTKRVPFNEGDIDAAAVDFDNDGLVDLSVTRDSKYESSYRTPDQKAWFGLMHQNGDGTFTSMGLASGINDRDGTTDRVKAGQNVGWSDIDGDGDLDVLIGGRDNGGKGRANFLFENTVGQKNGWVGVRLRGDGTAINRDAIGARVTLLLGDKKLVREIKSSRGTYSSADSRSLLFGLGAQGCDAGLAQVAMEVRWPNGEVKRLEAGSFGLNQYLTVDYATGLVAPSK